MLGCFADIFGDIIKYLYEVLGNYGAALIAFTFFVKLVVFPVNFIMYRSSVKTAIIQEKLDRIRIRFYGDRDAVNRETLKTYKEYQYNPFLQLIPLMIQLLFLASVLKVVWNPHKYIPGIQDTVFISIDLSAMHYGWPGILIAAVTCLSSLCFYLTEDHLNMMQKTLSPARRISNIFFSALLSLWLGYFAPAGAALYWITGNLISTLTEALMFLVLRPDQKVDLASFQSTRNELLRLESRYKKPFRPSFILRTRKDSKRFFGIEGKHLVFYSEGDGFYKYFNGMITWLLKNTNIPIHYVTSDPYDSVFEKEDKENGFFVYYIDRNSLIPFMMRMDADVVAMTMPDLENYQIKRSFIRNDIEYVNVCHGIGSYNMTFRKGAVDHFDTLFLAGPHQTREVREAERVYHLSEKKIVEAGYPLLDEMIISAEKRTGKDGPIIIAPSWHQGNIMELCIEPLAVSLASLKKTVIIRPHPQYTAHHEAELRVLKERLSVYPEIRINTDFAEDDELTKATLLVSDWSSIAFEYAFSTLRPVLFVNVPMKIMNPDYKEIQEIPFDIYARGIIGCAIEPEDVCLAHETVRTLIDEAESYKEKIMLLRAKSVSHIGESAQVYGRYLAETVLRHNQKRKKISA